VLWSARYPCQHRLSASFGSDSTPKPFGLASLPSLYDSTNRAPSTPALGIRLTCSTASCSISRVDFSLLSSVPVTGPSRFPQSRPCGVLWSARYPCQLHLAVSLGPDSAPDSFASRCGFCSASKLSTWTDGSGGSSACAAGPFHSHFLDPSSVRLAFLSRDPAACSGLHATPASFTLRLFWTWQNPRLSRLSVRQFACAPCGSPGGGLFRLHLRFRGRLFPLSCPGPVVVLSRFPQPRPCGVLWSARYPCPDRLAASYGFDSTPDCIAHRCGL